MGSSASPYLYPENSRIPSVQVAGASFDLIAIEGTSFSPPKIICSHKSETVHFFFRAKKGATDITSSFATSVTGAASAIIKSLSITYTSPDASTSPSIDIIIRCGTFNTVSDTNCPTSTCSSLDYKLYVYKRFVLQTLSNADAATINLYFNSEAFQELKILNPNPTLSNNLVILETPLEVGKIRFSKTFLSGSETRIKIFSNHYTYAYSTTVSCLLIDLEHPYRRKTQTINIK